MLPRLEEHVVRSPNHMQRIGASPLAQLQFGRQWRLAPTADAGRYLTTPIRYEQIRTSRRPRRLDEHIPHRC